MHILETSKVFVNYCHRSIYKKCIKLIQELNFQINVLVLPDYAHTSQLDLFHSDYGFKLNNTYRWNRRCIEDKTSNNFSHIHEVPSHCPAGTFYSFTRGYVCVL